MVRKKFNPVCEIDKWIIPFTDNIQNLLKSLDRNNIRKISSKRFHKGLSPADFYCYLKGKWGEPNGFQMTLKDQSTDNLIHWHYTLMSGEYRIDIFGYLSYVEIAINGPLKLFDKDWNILMSYCQAEYKNNSQMMATVRNSLEKWRIFINPYARLERIVTSLNEKIISLEAKAVIMNSDERSINTYSKMIDFCHEVSSIGLSLRILIPIWGESFINMIIFILAKKEFKSDDQRIEELFRKDINDRIKELHNLCYSFLHPLDLTDPIYKRFKQIMDYRNDLVHGNVNPRRFFYEEVYFDKIIPLFKHPEPPLYKHALYEIKGIEPKIIAKEVENMSNFITWVMQAIDKETRMLVEMILYDIRPGLKTQDKRCGSLFPDITVDSFV